MNKLILISLVIFFAISSKSWAGEIDGKGLICKFAGPDNTSKATLDVYGRIRYYLFEDGEAIQYHLNIWKTHIETINQGKYIDYDTTIYFYYISIDRKTLIHEFYDAFGNGDPVPEIYYQCEVSNKKEILNILNKITKKSLEQIKKEREKAREGNKI